MLVLLVLVGAVVWVALGYLAFRSGVAEANERLDPRAEQAVRGQGSLLANPSNLLLLGTDAGPGKGRERGNARTDSIMVVRTDPGENRVALLSIPRDLRVVIPGRGADKVNAAYAYGGPALTIKTVELLTGLGIDHVAVVDFRRFSEVVDALGGVTVTVPREILSNRFDCPYKTRAECQRWEGWHFQKGTRKLDGKRALIYARIRKNQLDPSETDFARARRQQQIVQAIGDEAVSVRTFARLPFIGDDLVKPLATDLTAGELTQLAWIKFRSPEDSIVRCRLGGTLSSDGAYIMAEDTRLVIAMLTGEAAPQPPPPDTLLFGPGCFVGRSR